MKTKFTKLQLIKKLNNIRNLIETIESRAMAIDGPVNNTRNEMTDAELIKIYKLSKV